ncbi:hypothetical protein AZI98_11910 [Aeribacillus pallidus]|uniref:Uncharacterized protein n=1 Tax=Aeribacillus pallidus TaxID=33936 RepID=A0A165X9K2_9BACI|nr:hypothetical protein AZI98_11910 [Aeribacillus pallidus]
MLLSLTFLLLPKKFFLKIEGELRDTLVNLEEAVVLIRHSTFSSHLFPFRQQAGCQKRGYFLESSLEEIYAKRTNLLLIFVKSFA